MIHRINQPVVLFSVWMCVYIMCCLTCRGISLRLGLQAIGLAGAPYAINCGDFQLKN